MSDIQILIAIVVKSLKKYVQNYFVVRKILMIFALSFKFSEQKYKNSTTMAIPQKDYSFANGLQLLSVEAYKKVNEEIYSFLHCTSRSQYSTYKKHFKNVPQHIYAGINEIFAKYGICNPSDIWTIS